MEIRRINNDELYHHGVKGQRWGVRRYQNPDGTLTSAGQKRLYKDVKKDIKRAKKLQERELKAGRQLYAQTLGNTGRKIAKKEEDALYNKRRDIERRKDSKLDESIKLKVTDKEKKQLQKLIKTDMHLESAIDEVEWGTPKYEKLMKDSEETRTQINKIYSDVGERVAGKYLNKRVSGSKFWGTDRTMKDEIGSRLWNQAVDDLIEKDKW